MDAVKSYKDAGVSRVIIGTAAVKDEPFLLSALDKYGELVAVGADIKEGRIAIKGWLEVAPITLDDFMTRMQSAPRIVDRRCATIKLVLSFISASKAS